MKPGTRPHCELWKTERQVYFRTHVPSFKSSCGDNRAAFRGPNPEPRHFPLLVNSLNIHNIAEWKLWCWLYRWKPEGQRGAGPHPPGFQNSPKSSQGQPQIWVWWRSGQTVNLGGLKWHSVLASLSFPTPTRPQKTLQSHLARLSYPSLFQTFAEVSCCLKPFPSSLLS